MDIFHHLAPSGSGNSVEGDDGHLSHDTPSSSSSRNYVSKNKKRKRSEEEKDSKPVGPPIWDLDPDEEKKSEQWIPIVKIISEAKRKLQSAEKKNGVTFALIGSSGCGKSSIIRKVFIDQLFTKVAKEEDKKEFIIQVFTESSKSDAFDGLAKDKNILMDCKGLDEDIINWAYHMNEKYDKKYNFMFILDDVLDVRFKKLVRSMFLTMRNTNISSLISLQYPNLIPKSVRTSVYFTILFFFAQNEGIELAVRGWMTPYLTGRNIEEKILQYRTWTNGADGHQMFLLDNLNHKCYYVNAEYNCKEIPMITMQKKGWKSGDKVGEYSSTPRKRTKNEFSMHNGEKGELGEWDDGDEVDSWWASKKKQEKEE